eukprot:403331173
MKRYQQSTIYSRVTLLLVGLLAFSVMVSAADTKVVDPAEKARLREERFQQKKKLESCLTLKTIQDFVVAHPTQQKDRLMNKILAQMMIHCRDRITPEQNVTLQSYKDHANDFDHTQKAYADLLNFELERYRVDETLPKEKQEGPIDMTQQEAMMTTVVEDLSEEMKREREEEMKNTRGAPSIFFVELSNISSTVGILYMFGIIGFFGIIFYVLINKIINKPVDFNQSKKQERSSKRSSGKKTN